MAENPSAAKRRPQQVAAENTPPRFDVIVLGGGAAGLFCAIEAGKRQRRVLVLEHNDRTGRKIEISGGRRCNFTNLYTNPDAYISRNPNFCRSALARYSPHDFIALAEQHGLTYHEKKLGQLFCDQQSQGIIDMLLEECRRAQVEIQTGRQVRHVEYNGLYRVHTNHDAFESPVIVVASGGLSIAKLGASDLGYRIAAHFELPCVETRPGLVPLTLTDPDRERWRHLQGVSFAAEATYRSSSFHENVLFTHRGLSGPAILQISSYWQKGQPLYLNLLPSENGERFFELHERREATLSNLLSQHMPKRFAKSWCEEQKWDRPLRQLSVKEKKKVIEALTRWPIVPDDYEGYHKAEVTVGGIDTQALSPKTMEAKHQPGLYFIGEVVDVTGWLGGYNFQWAWASGYCAGNAL